MHCLSDSAAFEKMCESKPRNPEDANEGQVEQVEQAATADEGENRDASAEKKRDSGFPSFQWTPADDEVFGTSTSTQLETALEAQAKGSYTVPGPRRRAPTIPPGFESQYEFYTHAPPHPAPPTFAEQYGWPPAPPSQEAIDVALSWRDGNPVLQQPPTAFDIRRLNARGIPIRPAPNLNAEAAPFVPVQELLQGRQHHQREFAKPKSRFFEDGKPKWEV